VWGTGIFGEYLKPTLVKGVNSIGFEHVEIGGAFAVILDTNGKTLVWGANTNGEMGLGDITPRTVPTYLESIEDKKVFSIGVGGSFAFALGQRLRSHDNF
jgi:alpha-tubulin suppressor-like RCC1 family protein